MNKIILQQKTSNLNPKISLLNLPKITITQDRSLCRMSDGTIEIADKNFAFNAIRNLSAIKETTTKKNERKPNN